MRAHSTICSTSESEKVPEPSTSYRWKSSVSLSAGSSSGCRTSSVNRNMRKLSVKPSEASVKSRFASTGSLTPCACSTFQNRRIPTHGEPDGVASAAAAKICSTHT